MKVKNDQTEKKLKEINSLQEQINHFIDERNKIYKTVQDMSVDYFSTERAISRIKSISTDIKRLESRVRQLNKE